MCGSSCRTISYKRRRILFRPTADLCTFLLTTTAKRDDDRRLFSVAFIVNNRERTARPFLYTNRRLPCPWNRCFWVSIYSIVYENIATILAMFSILYRQARSTLTATALQNSAASFCRNTSAKPVSTGTMTCVWLMGSFWHIFGIVLYFSFFLNMTLGFYYCSQRYNSLFIPSFTYFSTIS